MTPIEFRRIRASARLRASCSERLAVRGPAFDGLLGVQQRKELLIAPKRKEVPVIGTSRLTRLTRRIGATRVVSGRQNRRYGGMWRQLRPPFRRCPTSPPTPDRMRSRANGGTHFCSSGPNAIAPGPRPGSSGAPRPPGPTRPRTRPRVPRPPFPAGEPPHSSSSARRCEGPGRPHPCRRRHPRRRAGTGPHSRSASSLVQPLNSGRSSSMYGYTASCSIRSKSSGVRSATSANICCSLSHLEYGARLKKSGGS